MRRNLILAGVSAFALLTAGIGPASAAGAEAEVNGGLTKDSTSVDNGSTRASDVTNSHNNASGIVTEQQNNGNNNRVNAATAVGTDVIGGDDLNIDATVDVSAENNDTTNTDGTRNNTITESFRNFNGTATVQQNNGDHNDIGAATAVYGAAASVENISQTATSVARTTEQTTDGGPLTDDNSARDNTISERTFNNSGGAATVQQNNGNGNAMAATTSIASTTGDADDITQEVSATADADSSAVRQLGSSDRSNSITDSFNNADGVVTVQQNNGDSNAIAAATAVAAVTGDAEDITQDVRAIDNDIDGIDASDESAGARTNLINPSFNNTDGVITVQQNNGSANQMSAASGVVASVGEDAGDIDQDVLATFSDVADFDDVNVADDGGVRSNDILDSFNNSTGVTIVQQNNGDGNTINAAHGVAFVGDDAGNVDQTVESNDARIDDGANVVTTDGGSERANTIDSSFRNYAGGLTVQENNGSANAMQSSIGLVSVGGDVGDVNQDQVEAEDNTVDLPETTDEGSTRNNAIQNGSFNGAAGIIQVQQNNGDANTMNASTGVVLIGEDAEDVTQGTNVDVEDNAVSSEANVSADASRDNAISGSFNNTAGVITVQQNNGDANSMNAATTVFANDFVEGADIDSLTQNGVEAEDNSISDSEIHDFGSTRSNSIADSFNPTSGTSTVQQNNGGGNSINATSVVATVGNDVFDDVTQQLDVDENDVTNIVVSTSGGADRDNSISNSFRNADGIHTVQQNNGDANTMNAGTVVATVGDDVSNNVEQTVDLANNDVTDVKSTDLNGASTRDNAISDSFNGADGIVTVQQNNGGGNTINAGSAVVSAGVRDSGDVDDVTQTVNVAGDVAGVHTEAFPGTRDNTINPSFNNADGIITVQQNNGDANSMGSGTAVVVSDGADDVSQNVKAAGKVFDIPKFEDDNGNERSNTIDQSFRNSDGTVTVQQNNGDANSMQAATAHLFLRDGDNQDSTNDTEQTVEATGSVTDAFLTDDDRASRGNFITGSYGNASGVHTVQQNSGTANVMAAATAVVVDQSDLTSGGGEDVDLQTVTTDGTVFNATSDIDGSGAVLDRKNAISASFGGFAGVVTVQQNNGDNNVVLAATAVRAHNMAEDGIDNVDEATSATSGKVEDTEYNLANQSPEDLDATNFIDGSFNGAAGIVTVQENNGNQNVIGSATGVVANIDTPDAAAGPIASSATGFASVTNGDARIGPSSTLNNEVNASFNNADVVATIQQNNGHNNVMGAATQVTADDNGNFGPAVALATLSGTVSGNDVTLVGAPSSFTNSINGSFNGTSGVVTVQQNNGSGNAISSAVTVVTNF